VKENEKIDVKKIQKIVPSVDDGSHVILLLKSAAGGEIPASLLVKIEVGNVVGQTIAKNQTIVGGKTEITRLNVMTLMREILKNLKKLLKK